VFYKMWAIEFLADAFEALIESPLGCFSLFCGSVGVIISITLRETGTTPWLYVPLGVVSGFILIYGFVKIERKP
jgi:hypothetical protein